MARRAYRISLPAAAERAARAGLLRIDFYELTDDQRTELSKLRSETNWRQSSTSRSLGRSAERAFHSALSRASRRLPAVGSASEAERANAQRVYDHAVRVATQAVKSPTRSNVEAAIDAYEVAADAFYQIGDEARARRVNESADRWAEDLRALYQHPRATTRRQVNGDTLEFAWHPRTRQWSVKWLGKSGTSWLPVSTTNARTLDEAERQAAAFIRGVRGRRSG